MIESLERTLYEVQQETNTVMTRDDCFYVFVMANGSDSVKLVYTHSINDGGWSVEIYPINGNKGIQEFQFSSKSDAIKAFQVFTSYYTLVVKENFKMF